MSVIAYYQTSFLIAAPQDLTPIAPDQISIPAPPAKIKLPSTTTGEKPFPINLPTALKLAGIQPLDIAVATERINLAAAQLDRAKVLWLPNIQFGADYFRHDGRIQSVQGDIFDTSRSSLMVGVGPTAVFAVTDAIFKPLAARRVVNARNADLRTATNDSFLAVAEAYFNVQQARGELAGAEDSAQRADDLVRRVEKLTAPGVDIVAPSELNRARTELARRRQAVHAAREHWRIASADLVRILRLDVASIIEPLEPPHLKVTLVGPDRTVDELIPQGLMNRPELASQQALVEATLKRLKAERMRPLIPSLLLRGASTNPAGTLAAGTFGGGRNESVNHFGARADFDVQVLWELQNLGFGNKARVNERKAENQIAVLALFRIQDRIAAEIAQAHAQVLSAAERVTEAEVEVKNAVESVIKNLEGMRQPQGGNVVILVNRPQEVVAAVQSLAVAYADYYAAVGDFNRGQFRLYRALGNPVGSECCASPKP